MIEVVWKRGVHPSMPEIDMTEPTDAPIDLVCMRLANMKRVHPDQITLQCSSCGEKIGVFPSGQKVLRDHGDRVKLFCEVCRMPGPDARLAPGAAFEPFESRRKK